MKIKTSELSGIALDWAVAKSEGIEPYNDEVLEGMEGYSPSSDWSQGGPIIERERIDVAPLILSSCWVAWKGSDPQQEGETLLIAAMRCYVASKLGEGVEIPDELVKEG